MCYGAKYFTLNHMEKHQLVRTFDTYSKTSSKYILSSKLEFQRNQCNAIGTVKVWKCIEREIGGVS